MFNAQAINRDIATVLQKQLFFIKGVPKSGTTWLQRLTDAHPQISCSGEAHISNEFRHTLFQALHDHNDLLKAKNQMLYSSDHGYPLFTNDHARYLLLSAYCLLLGSQAGAAQATCIGEKTPETVISLPLLVELFPDAKYVHIVRDGRDCAVSGWFHNLRRNRDETEQRFGDFNTYATAFARQWQTDVQFMRDFFADRPGKCVEIRYEDLLSDAAGAHVAQLFRFLGVEETPEIVAHCLESTSFRRFSGGREAGQEDTDSHYRKGISGDWRNHFDDGLTERFSHLAGATLASLGYADGTT